MSSGGHIAVCRAEFEQLLHAAAEDVGGKAVVTDWLDNADPQGAILDKAVFDIKLVRLSPARISKHCFVPLGELFRADRRRPARRSSWTRT